MNSQQALIQVKKLFKDNLFERRVISKRGRLETTRLSSYRTSNKLFSQPTATKGKEYNVEILVDGSGSMHHAGILDEAFLAAQNVVSILQYVTKINVTAFNYTETSFTPAEFLKLSFREYKDIVFGTYKQEYIGDDMYLVPGEDREKRHYGNWELCNIQNAVNRLNQKKGGKIIMLLLDGMMNLDDYGGTTPPSNLHIAGHSCGIYNYETYEEWLRKYKNQGIDIVAFGIQTTQPRRYFEKYNEFVYIEDANEIFDKMTQYLKKVI